MLSHRVYNRFQTVIWRCLEVAGLAIAIALALVAPARGSQPTDSTATAIHISDRPQVSTSQADLFRPTGYGATVADGLPLPPATPAAAETLTVPFPPRPQWRLLNACVGDCGGPSDMILPAGLPYAEVFPPPVRPLFATPQQILFTGTPANPSIIGFKQTFF